MALVGLSGCDNLSSQDILEIIKKLQKPNQPGNQAPTFESDDPASVQQGPGLAIPETAKPGLDQSKDEEGASDDKQKGDASKAIAEADLIQRRGNLLYALSEFRGLTIIDVENPDRLKVIGEFNVDASAFEMYVQDGVVMAMLRNVVSYQEPETEDGYAQEQRQSALLVLDASNPANIRKLAHWSVPGQILDSRKVGDHLFIMSHENGACWGCAKTPQVHVTSFSLLDPKNPVALSDLKLEIPQRSWGPAPSLVSTPEHLYIALNDRHSKEGAKSAIRAVDISNPADLKELSSISVSGAINSRWQMNEYQDVLRVVTQVAGSLEAPEVETFSVADLTAPKALGKLTMKLPRPEQLQAVRFDKTRGYAITFERTDPLFTLDLSEPSAPKQLGELEIPGWVYHMEPRGERLLGIGYDRRNPDGSLNASLFDVSDLNKPTMISRVHFGGSWANFAEGRNQIHKAFNVWDTQGLLAIPFRGNENVKELVNTDDGDTIECQSYRPRNGVMLIDWQNDTLKLRGEASTDGVAKRSLLLDDRLLAVSDQTVQSYDIRDRDRPQETSRVNIAVNAQRLLPLGNGLVLRQRQAMDHHDLALDIVQEGNENSTSPVGSIRYTLPRGQGCRYNGHVGQIFAHQGFVFVEKLSSNPLQKGQGTRRELLAFDIRNPRKPNFVKRNRLENQLPFGLDNGLDGLPLGGETLLQDHNYLYLAQANGRDWKARSVDSEIVIYQLSGPDVIEQKRIKRPTSRYASRMSKSGRGLVSSWYAVASNPKDPSKITFHWQEFSTATGELKIRDLAVPGVPLLSSKNGMALLTLGFEGKEIEKLNEKECFDQPGARSYDDLKQRCQIMKRTLHRLSMTNETLTEVGREPLTQNKGFIQSLVKRGDRLAFTVATQHHFPGPVIFKDTMRPTAPASDAGTATSIAKSIAPMPMNRSITEVLSLGDTANLRRANLPQVKNNDYGGSLSFVGDRKLLRRSSAQLELFDLSELPGAKRTQYARDAYQWSCYNALLQDEDILCAAGQYGVRRLQPLETE